MRLLFSVAFIGTSALLHAQGREKVVETDSGRVILHYFTTGQISTKEWTDADGRWGRSWAFARDGHELINYQTRKIGGHASVRFSYHANGGISKAEISDAPDGGIQWYRSVTTFDPEGNRTGFTEEGHDNDGLIPRPAIRVHDGPGTAVPPPASPMEEQELFVSDVLLVNGTRWPAIISVHAAQPSPALPGGSFTLQAGDTVHVGSFSTGAAYEEPGRHVTFDARRQHKRPRKQKSLPVLLLQQQESSKDRRRYIYHVVP